MSILRGSKGLYACWTYVFSVQPFILYYDYKEDNGRKAALEMEMKPSRGTLLQNIVHALTLWVDEQS